jgi:hypothetical protein
VTELMGSLRQLLWDVAWELKHAGTMLGAYGLSDTSEVCRTLGEKCRVESESLAARLGEGDDDEEEEDERRPVRRQGEPPDRAADEGVWFQVRDMMSLDVHFFEGVTDAESGKDFLADLHLGDPACYHRPGDNWIGPFPVPPLDRYSGPVS